MSRTVITMSRTIFFRFLAHAPEELQREPKEDARRVILALRLHGRRHPGRFAEEKLWDRQSEDVEREDIQSLMDAGEYDQAAKLANEAIAETVVRYIHEAMLEKEEQQEEIAWLCFEELRQPSRGQMNPAPEPGEVETLKHGFAAERRDRSRRLGIISPGTPNRSICAMRFHRGRK